VVYSWCSGGVYRSLKFGDSEIVRPLRKQGIVLEKSY
jgi:hypothetical protein